MVNLWLLHKKSFDFGSTIRMDVELYILAQPLQQELYDNQGKHLYYCHCIVARICQLQSVQLLNDGQMRE